MFHIWRLYSLQIGGYPFEKDDLTEEEWLDVGALRSCIESMRLG
jgi:hypothetical protein